MRVKSVLAGAATIVALGGIVKGGEIADKAHDADVRNHDRLVRSVGTQMLKDGFKSENIITDPDPNYVDLALGKCVFQGAEYKTTEEDGVATDAYDYSIDMGQILVPGPKRVLDRVIGGVTIHFEDAQQLQEELSQLNCFPD